MDTDAKKFPGIVVIIARNFKSYPSIGMLSYLQHMIAALAFASIVYLILAKRVVGKVTHVTRTTNYTRRSRMGRQKQKLTVEFRGRKNKKRTITVYKPADGPQYRVGDTIETRAFRWL